jgi:hypothetical protein
MRDADQPGYRFAHPGYACSQTARCETRKALRKGRLFRAITLRRLRQNQDSGIGSRRKPTSIEALKAHRGMTRE